MEREYADQFSRDVETYRKTLLELAYRNERERFEAIAGRMFDYIESVEFRELERRFFRIFFGVLAGIVTFAAVLLTIDFELHNEWIRHKNSFLMSLLAVSCFEVYFFLTYQRYMRNKLVLAQKRRDRFIRGIEQDFLAYANREDRKAA